MNSESSTALSTGTDPLLIVGRSHMTALRDAAEAAPQLRRQVRFVNTAPYEPLADPKAPSPKFSDEFAARLLKASSGASAVVFLVQGNQHLGWSLFARTPPLDLVVSEAPDLPLLDESQIVPERVFLEHFERSQRDLTLLLDFFATQLPQLERIVMGPPPPIESNEFVSSRLDPVLVGKASKLGIEVAPESIAPSLVRWKVWSLLNRTYEWCAKQSRSIWVPQPASALDGKYLKREYWGTDASHANSSYGKLRLAQLGVLQ